MIVELGAESAHVLDADNCRSLHVVTSLPRSDVDVALRRAELGYGGSDGLPNLDISALHSLARPESTSPDWEANWSAMISFATGKGWVSADGSSVRAHIEPGA